MSTIQVHDKRFKTYLPAAEIAREVARLAQELGRDFRGKDPLFIPILNGAFMFASDLLRALDFDVEIAFVKYASYEGTNTTGVVKELIGFPESVRGRHVVLVEDVVDTGISMAHTLERVQAMQPASVSVCTFFFKPDKFVKHFKIDYIGRTIPNDFILGYGLDYNGLGRTYADVYVLDEPQPDNTPEK